MVIGQITHVYAGSSNEMDDVTGEIGRRVSVCGVGQTGPIKKIDRLRVFQKGNKGTAKPSTC